MTLLEHRQALVDIRNKSLDISRDGMAARELGLSPSYWQSELQQDNSSQTEQ